MKIIAIVALVLAVAACGTLGVVIAKPETVLGDVYSEPEAERALKSLRSMRNDVIALEREVGPPDGAFDGDAFDDSGLASRVNTLEDRIEDACGQLYEYIDDSQGC